MSDALDRLIAQAERKSLGIAPFVAKFPKEFFVISSLGGLYAVSACGEVRSVFNPTRPLATMLDKDGYQIVTVTTDEGRRKKRVHRLVAETFIPNPHRLPQVNHINTVKTDNRVENLEWVTGLRNVHHWRTLKSPKVPRRRKWVPHFPMLIEYAFASGKGVS